LFNTFSGVTVQKKHTNISLLSILFFITYWDFSRRRGFKNTTKQTSPGKREKKMILALTHLPTTTATTTARGGREKK
jgi:hypothetical protein